MFDELLELLFDELLELLLDELLELLFDELFELLFDELLELLLDELLELLLDELLELLFDELLEELFDEEFDELSDELFDDELPATRHIGLSALSACKSAGRAWISAAGATVARSCSECTAAWAGTALAKPTTDTSVEIVIECFTFDLLDFVALNTRHPLSLSYGKRRP